MKILVATTSMPRYKGDNRSPFILDLSKELVLLGNHVTLVSMHIPGTKESEIIDGVKVIRLRYAKEQNEQLQSTRAGLPAALRTDWRNIFYIYKYFVVLRNFISKHEDEFDIIHSNWTLAGLASIRLSFKNTPQKIITLHGSDLEVGHENICLRSFTKFTLNSMDGIICVSKALQENLRLFGIQKNKSLVIPNGYDPNLFYPGTNAGNPRRILFVGSITKQKGVFDLVGVYEKLYKQDPNYELVIIGDGPDQANLKQVISNTPGKIFFLPSMDRKDIANQMRNAGIFCLPSYKEGFGVVLLEAMASGLPCIAYRTGGIPDLLGNDNGILVDTGSLTNLVKGILLMRKQEVYNFFRLNGLKTAEQYQWNKIAKRVMSFYASLCKRNFDLQN